MSSGRDGKSSGGHTASGEGAVWGAADADSADDGAAPAPSPARQILDEPTLPSADHRREEPTLATPMPQVMEDAETRREDPAQFLEDEATPPESHSAITDAGKPRAKTSPVTFNPEATPVARPVARPTPSPAPRKKSKPSPAPTPSSRATPQPMGEEVTPTELDDPRMMDGEETPDPTEPPDHPMLKVGPMPGPQRRRGMPTRDPQSLHHARRASQRGQIAPSEDTPITTPVVKQPASPVGKLMGDMRRMWRDLVTKVYLPTRDAILIRFRKIKTAVQERFFDTTQESTDEFDRDRAKDWEKFHKGKTSSSFLQDTDRDR